MAPDPLDLEVRDLVVRHAGGHIALAGLDLTVHRGELVALVGPNGAGKSTLLRCVVGLQAATSGSVRLGGVEVTRAGPLELRALRRDVGMVFQRLNLMPRLRVHASVLHGGLGRHGLRSAWPVLAGNAQRRAAMACLHRVGLAELAERRVGSLSGGQQQRVAVARMLAQRPRLVLADEPVASLDPASASAVLGLLREIAEEEHLTVVVALHQLEYARRFAHRIIGLRDGRCALDAAPVGCSADALDRLYAAS
ncbi:MAG: phosphonate ABC transporter ATP-binding protein [Pseudonocardia sp.]|nr:phosphonate ABC transporter ATP-binding protein [Pseudonocardia sp.]